MRVQALVTLLESRYQELLSGMCSELQQRFCVCGLYATVYPHFSYQVAADFDAQAVGPLLAAVAQRTRPFRVRVTTLGVFPMANPIIYLSVVRTEALSRLHRQLWEATEGLTVDPVQYYHPEYWIPHITLAHGDVERENLTDILFWLQKHPPNWELTVDNVALIYAEGFEQGEAFRLPLAGEG